MSDATALLAAILADPKEDTPRLVYADWLTENGQPERAEFIRVQVELMKMVDEKRALDGMAQMPIATDLDKCTYKGKPISKEFWDSIWRCKELRHRERELLEAGAVGWAATCGEFGGEVFYGFGIAGMECESDRTSVCDVVFGLFSRGLVSGLICKWDHFRTHADAITAQQPIERVKLTTWPEFWRNGSPTVGIASTLDRRVRFEVAGEIVTLEEPSTCAMVLTLRWPRIEFELPPEPRWQDYQWSFAGGRTTEQLQDDLARATQTHEFIPPNATNSL